MGCLINSVRINCWLSIAAVILMLIFGAPWRWTLGVAVGGVLSWLFVKVMDLRP